MRRLLQADLPAPLLDVIDSGLPGRRKISFELACDRERAQIDRIYSRYFAADTYDPVMEAHYAAHREILTTIHPIIEFPLVDLGCGTGKLIGMLLEIPEFVARLRAYAEQKAGPAIICIDLNRNNILRTLALLHDRLDQLQLFLGDDGLGFDCTSNKVALVCSAFEELGSERLRGFQLNDFARSVIQSYVIHWAGGGVRKGELSILAWNERLMLAKKRVLKIAYAICAPESRLFTFEEYPLHFAAARSANPNLEVQIRAHTSQVKKSEHAILADSAGFRKLSERVALIQDPTGVHEMTGQIWEKTKT